MEEISIVIIALICFLLILVINAASDYGDKKLIYFLTLIITILAIAKGSLETFAN